MYRIHINDNNPCGTWLTRIYLHDQHTKARIYSFSFLSWYFSNKICFLFLVFSSFSPLLYLIAFHLSRLLSASMLHISFCPYSPCSTLTLVSTCGLLSSFTIYTHTHLFTHMQTPKLKICTWERMWFSFWAFSDHLTTFQTHLFACWPLTIQLKQ